MRDTNSSQLTGNIENKVGATPLFLPHFFIFNSLLQSEQLTRLKSVRHPNPFLTAKPMAAFFEQIYKFIILQIR